MYDFQNYINPELLIVVAMLYIIGLIIKQTKTVSNKYIPAILGVIGIVLCFIYTASIDGFTSMSLFTGVTQGILCAGSAVYVNQLIKQTKK